MPLLGFDLDNTIIDHDPLLRRVAVDMGLLPGGVPTSKRGIRDAIREGPGGDPDWQRVQAVAYGPRLHESLPFSGAREVLEAAHAAGWRLAIVSHKTRHARLDAARTDLRAAALGWLRDHGFLDAARTGLGPQDVHFADDREAKIARIRELGCAWFVDDLEETFLAPGFPQGVGRVLFDPSGSSAPPAGVLRARNWKEVADLVLGGGLPPTGPWCVLGPLAGGRNARVELLEDASGRRFVRKRYPPAAPGARDRFDAERRALDFLAEAAPGRAPRPVDADPVVRELLYEFVQGVAVRPAEASDEDFARLAAFAALLRDLRDHPRAAGLPMASEACFSIDGVVRSVEARHDRLLRAPRIPGAEAFVSFLESDLGPALAIIAEGTRRRAAERALDPARELPRASWTLSPSDFGFHNAVRVPGGDLVFLDFEHFGWDDPAKLIADLLLHPAMELDAPRRARVASAMLAVFAGVPAMEERLRLLLPLYALKWCTILLNEFLPQEMERRELAAGGTLALRQVQAEQLLKARRMLIEAWTSYERRTYLP